MDHKNAGNTEADTHEKAETDARSESEPGKGQNKASNGTTHNETNDGGDNLDNHTEECTNKRNPSKKLHNWGEKQCEANHAREDSAGSHACTKLSDSFVTLSEHNISSRVSFINVKDNFFKHGVHTAVNALADVAVPATGFAIFVNVGGGLGAPWHFDLQGVPLAEGPLVFVVLNKLTDEGHLTTRSVFKLHSERAKVTRVGGLFEFAGAVHVFFKWLEVHESISFHSLVGLS